MITDWAQHTAPDGRAYWHSPSTGQSVWTKPDELKSSREKLLDAQGYTEYDSNGRKYYVHKATNQTTWELPPHVKDAIARQGAIMTPSMPGPSLSGPTTPMLAIANTPASGSGQSTALVTMGSVMPVDISRIREQGAPVGGISAPDFKTAADLEKAFFSMLRTRGVKEHWTWEQAIREIVTEPVYKAFPSMVERRAAFDRFKVDEAKRLVDVRKRNIDRLRPAWRQGLSRASEGPDGIKTWWSWSKAKKELSEGLPDMWHMARDDFERKALWDEHIGELRKVETEREKALRERQDEKLKALFAKLKLDPTTTWQQARRLAERSADWDRDLELQSAEPNQVLAAFEDAARLIEREANELRQKTKETKRRTERKRREAFIALLTELKLDGHIVAGTRWIDILPRVDKDPRYLDLLGQPGSTALELFWDTVDTLDLEVEDAARVVDAAFTEGNQPEMTEQTTWEAFMVSIRAVEHRLKVKHDERMLRNIYQRLRDRAERIAKDERRRAERRVRQQMDNLRYAMKKAGIEVDATYEQASERLRGVREYEDLTDGEARRTAFDKYIRRLKERIREGSDDGSVRSSSRRDATSGSTSKRDREREPEKSDRDHRRSSGKDRPKERESDRRKTRSPETEREPKRPRLDEELEEGEI